MQTNCHNLPCKSYEIILIDLKLINQLMNIDFFDFRLQQVADAGISLILLVAFSLVVAGSSVYIVNERLNGEKLQQKLCDVSFKTYWGVAFLWDIIVSQSIQSIAFQNPFQNANNNNMFSVA